MFHVKISEQYGPARCVALSGSEENTFYVGTSKNCLLKFNGDFTQEEPISLVSLCLDDNRLIDRHPYLLNSFPVSQNIFIKMIGRLIRP